MIMFNGGQEAGARVEHRHLQVFPKAPHVDLVQPLALEPRDEGE